MTNRYTFAAGLVATTLTSAASLEAAPISYTTAGQAVLTDFNNLAGPAAGRIDWVDGETVAGFYLYMSGATDVVGGNSATISTPAGSPGNVYRNPANVVYSNNYYATTPAGNLPAGAYWPFHAWSSTANGDVRLKSLNAETNSEGENVGYIAMGMALTNNSADTLDAFTLSYNLYNSGGLTTEGLAFSYSTNATGLADESGTWTSVTALSGGGLGTYTGTPTPITVNGVAWAPGQTLFFRWRDPNVAGTDRALLIDNVNFSAAVPEPTTLALLGLPALAMLRRRRA
jgi:hypothetical protein